MGRELDGVIGKGLGRELEVLPGRQGGKIVGAGCIDGYSHAGWRCEVGLLLSLKRCWAGSSKGYSGEVLVENLKFCQEGKGAIFGSGGIDEEHGGRVGCILLHHPEMKTTATELTEEEGTPEENITTSNVPTRTRIGTSSVPSIVGRRKLWNCFLGFLGILRAEREPRTRRIESR